MNFDLTYLEKLIDLLSKSDLSEMFIQDGDQLVELKKAKDITTVSTNVPQLSENIHSRENIVTATTDSSVNTVDTKKKAVTSPMVGTFYNAPSPTTKPFVSIGDTIATGQVVCIVEAMKLMNEIEAEVSGKVVQICVENGQPVEYGQVLMYVE